MRVLIACEFSGVVRRAFRALGHDAWSCDVLPAEDGDFYHLQRDARGVLDGCARPDHGFAKWDLLIAHPPCTRLCNSGVRWLYKNGRGTEREYTKWDEMIKAVDFFDALWRCDIPRRAIENPIMHSHAADRLNLPKPQIVQPWQFGHGEIKATCLWLKNLPPLVPTEIVEGRRARVHHEPPSPERWKNRSRTYAGIAAAMAEQWGAL